jgi:hypothetical protein
VEDDEWRHHDRPLVMLPAPFSLILMFSKLRTSLSCQARRFVIIKPFGADLDFNHVLYFGLAFA